MKTQLLIAASAVACWALPATAVMVDIDLSGAASGSLIDAPGASFAQAFVGQTVVGTGIVGSPSNPLTLDGAGGWIDVAFWDPGVSAASNSLLSQPGNAAPLSVLLDGLADSFNFTMGSSDAGSSITAAFFSSTGALVGSQTIFMGSGYNLYSLSGVGTFAAITFYDNNDSAGVRFQNMSYNAVVPEPGTWALMLGGLAVAGTIARRRRSEA